MENTWPEQDAVDDWLSDMGLDVDNRDSMKLKEAVTKPRIEIQHKAADLKRKLSEMEDDLTTAYMAGYHKRDDEVRNLRAHADALAGHMEVLIHEAVPRNHAEDRLWDKAQSLIDAHRQAREEGR